MIHSQFYTELGKVLYAIAFVDGSIQEAEVQELERYIKRILKSLPPDGNEDRIVMISKLRFYNCIKEHLKPKIAFHSFYNFMDKYGDKISAHDKDLAHQLITAIADAYKGLQQTELIHLHKIQQLFQKV
jgi:hypothetical protein